MSVWITLASGKRVSRLDFEGSECAARRSRVLRPACTGNFKVGQYLNPGFLFRCRNQEILRTVK